jgi:hypothetical protein
VVLGNVKPAFLAMLASPPALSHKLGMAANVSMPANNIMDQVIIGMDQAVLLHIVAMDHALLA